MIFLRFVIFFFVILFASWGIAVSKPTTSDGHSEKNESIQLRYKFKTYEVLWFTAEHKTIMDGTLEGVRELTIHESKFKKHYRVVHVDADGGALIEPVLDQVRMQLQFGRAKPTVYDSTSKEDPQPQFQRIQSTINRVLVRMRVSVTGELIKTTSLLSKEMEKKLGGGGKLSESDPTKNFLILLPEKSLKVGDGWTDKRKKIQLEVNPGLKREFTILKTYKLEKIENNVAKITFTSAITPPVRSPSLELQIVQLLPHGSIYFDIEKGRILERSSIVDKHIVGLAQRKGAMHVKTRHTERLVPSSSATALRKKPVK